VCVNTTSTSLVYRHTPKTLRFLMVDPKMVELSVYNTLPHLPAQGLTDNRTPPPAQVGGNGKQERYRVSSREWLPQPSGVQSPRAGCSCRSDTSPKGRGVRRHCISRWASAYIVVDHRRDATDDDRAGRVETPIAMLRRRLVRSGSTSSSRRTTCERITDLIKANFPGSQLRSVLPVRWQPHHHRWLGREMLLGNGDMLFISAGQERGGRLQGAVTLQRRDGEADGLSTKAQRDRRRGRARRAGLVFEAE